MSLKVIIAVVFSLFAAMSSAQAATSVYTDSSNFGGWPSASNAGDSLGGADGVSATIPSFGWIAYQTTTPFTTIDFYLKFSGVSGSGTVLFYVGRSDGAGWFASLNSRTVTLTNGANVLTNDLAQETYCAGLGGCDVFVVQAWTGGTVLNLDSAIAANPEPSAWAFMIIAFFGIALRMKQMRSTLIGGPRRLATA